MCILLQKYLNDLRWFQIQNFIIFEGKSFIVYYLVSGINQWNITC